MHTKPTERRYVVGQSVRIKETGLRGTVQAVIFRRTGVTFEVLLWEGIYTTLTIMESCEIEACTPVDTTRFTL